ncbi:MAG: hypothetical protein A2W28_08260 [Gammaproteobacteria bacterium RBG_16_51_14]|nr:MAG: hypothetical protein A2W28_08260 [Gammaproteobacteria bacterium RBG_16_51_14]
MDRREFFRNGFHEVSKAAVKAADAHCSDTASRWIRPPYALVELEFLLACTRCDKCTEVCPYQVIFPLPLRCGVQVAGTPAMDLQNKACHLCEDWPCVAVCEPRALQRPQPPAGKAVPLPLLAIASINTGTCLPYNGPECGACAACCPVSGALTWEMGKPRIDPGYCCGCAICREQCIADPKAIELRSVHKQNESTTRDRSCNLHDV